MLNKIVRAIAAGLVISLAGMGSAHAHSSVVSTTPLYKSTFTQMPEEIAIEFTDNLMVIEGKVVNTISMTDPNQESLSISKIVVDKNRMTAQLAPAEFVDGTYIVSYRVVSADGHSVSGSYELYLNSPTPSAQSRTNAATTEEVHGGFFHIHQTHLFQAGAVAILLFLWWGYRRFSPENHE